MQFRWTYPLLLTFLLKGLVFSHAAQAELVIIAHPGGPDSITMQQVKDIYLNRSNQLPNGQRAVAFAFTPGNRMRDEFNEQVLGRNDNWLKSFWSRQVLTGSGRPPKEMASANGMRSVVSSTLGGIGYIDSTLVDDSVKVILAPGLE